MSDELKKTTLNSLNHLKFGAGWGVSGVSGCTLFFSFIGIITGLEEKKTGWSRFNEDFEKMQNEGGGAGFRLERKPQQNTEP